MSTVEIDNGNILLNGKALFLLCGRITGSDDDAAQIIAAESSIEAVALFKSCVLGCGGDDEIIIHTLEQVCEQSIVADSLLVGDTNQRGLVMSENSGNTPDAVGDLKIKTRDGDALVDPVYLLNPDPDVLKAAETPEDSDESIAMKIEQMEIDHLFESTARDLWINALEHRFALFEFMATGDRELFLDTYRSFRNIVYRPLRSFCIEYGDRIEAIIENNEPRFAVRDQSIFAIRVLILRAFGFLMDNEPDHDSARDYLDKIRIHAENRKIDIKRIGLYSRFTDYFDDLDGNAIDAPEWMIVTPSIGSIQNEKDTYLKLFYEPLTKPMNVLYPSVRVEMIERHMNEHFPWMKPITRRLCLIVSEYQQYRAKAPVFGKPIILVGDPGSGKTHYVQEWADMLGLPSRIVSIGGMADNMMLRGLNRSWNGAKAGLIPDIINETRCPNPVIVLDEIDKAGYSRNNGDPYDTLLQLLEPRNAARFFDECLLSHLDLGRVSYIATANSTHDLPDPLKDRCTIWKVPSPKPEHLSDLAVRLWWKHWEDRGVPSSLVPEPNEDLIRRAVVKAISIREVKRIMGALIRTTVDESVFLRRH